MVCGGEKVAKGGCGIIKQEVASMADQVLKQLNQR